MAITYVNIGTRVDSGSGSPQTIAYPAGIASGDLLIVFGAHRTATAPAAPSSTLTWTEVATSSVNANESKVWTATYDGSATAPTAVPGSASYYSMAAIRGQAASSLDTSASSVASQVNMRYPALTIAGVNEIVFTFCRDGGTITSVAQTAGFTEIEDINLSASTWGIQIQYQIQGTAINILQTDPVVTGGSTITQIGITVAFKYLDTGLTWINV